MEMLSLLPFILFFVWLILFRGPRRSCPGCGALLPAYQSPLTKTKRQWLQGGFVCRHCGCEADLSGNKVRSATSLRRLAVGLALVGLAAVPAVAKVTGRDDADGRYCAFCGCHGTEALT
jgi:hypothetical protein